MTSAELATLSTALWVVGTVALFILLAEWSSGTSWGLTNSLVRGVRGWADRDGRPMPMMSPSAERLLPILDPYAFLRRNAPPSGASMPRTEVADVEIIELGERPIPRR